MRTAHSCSRIIDAPPAQRCSQMPDAQPQKAPPDSPDAHNTGFGPTEFDAPALAAHGRATLHSGLDMCHVGVVLRTLLLVHGVVGVALLFGATSASGWLARASIGSSVVLPGVLLWLVSTCGLKRWLAPLPVAGQAVVAAALGAFSAMFASAPAWLLSSTTLGPPPWLALALAGAGMALVIFQWLHLRAKATLPADTTARLAELQSRIRPHFLFNTLNTALALVRLDPARAEGVLEDLAELFRVAISDSTESVTLAEEVELAQRYIAIEQIRFGSRLRVTWDLDPAAGAARVPPLLLQPLVENAVRHGVEPADAGGVIRVRTRVKLGRVLVSIVNSVPPVPSRPGNGMALRNVRERLRLMHDVAAKFDTRQQGGEFRVQIIVPL